MTSHLRQPSFAAGEIDPVLRGRDDVELYAESVAKMRNFFATPLGPTHNRPGFEFLGRTIRYDEVEDGKGIRIVPFWWSDGKCYLLEFARGKMRVWLHGKQIMDPDDEENPYEIDVPWEKEEHLHMLRWAQVGDVMFLTSPANGGVWGAFAGQGVRVLTRHADDNWTLDHWVLYEWGIPSLDLSFPDEVGFDPSEFPPSEFPRREWLYVASLIDEENRESLTPANFDSSWGIKEVRIFITPEHRVKVYVPKGDTGISTSVGVGLLKDTTKIWLEDTWKGLFLVDSGGDTFHIVRNDMDSLSVITEALTAGTPAAGNYVITCRSDRAVIYRGRGGVVGRIGIADESESTYRFNGTVYQGEFFVFYDEGDEPDYSRQPRKRENPMAAQAALAIFQERLVAGGGYFRKRYSFDALGRRKRSALVIEYSPTNLVFSKTGDYRNFDYNVPVLLPDDSIEIELAAYRREEIRSLVPMHDLIVFTDGGVWSVNGAQGEPLNPGSIQAVLESEYGASSVLPVVIGESIVYATERGPGLRELRYDYRTRGYATRALSDFARHLFEGYQITAMAYSERPYNLLWALRSDGALLCATYRPDMERVAWHFHYTDGVIQDILVIPQGKEDALYAVIDRVINPPNYIEPDFMGTKVPEPIFAGFGPGETRRYLERLSRRKITDIREGMFVDSGYEYDGRVKGVLSGIQAEGE